MFDRERDHTLISKVFREPEVISGYVADPKDWAKRWVVELLLDGWSIDLARADHFESRMGDHGQPSADFGFAFDLRRFKTTRGASLEVKVANTDHVLAHIREAQPAGFAPPAIPGAVGWCGGLRFSGWLAALPADPCIVRGLIDENIVFEVRASALKMVEDTQGQAPRPAFDIHLPMHFADGKIRQLHVIDGESQALLGSPVSFLAFEDGLAAFLDQHATAPGERVRGTEFDRMFPQSLPFDMIEDWSGRFFPRPRQASGSGRVALVLVGDEKDAEATLQSIAGIALDWVLAVLPSKTANGQFHPEDLREFLSDHDDYQTVIMALSGTLFKSDALHVLDEALRDHAADLAYCDVIMRRIDFDHSLLPIAFPAFDYERMLEQGYAGWCFAISTNAASAAARAGANSLHALFFHALGSDLPSRTAPVHVPGFYATVPRISRSGTEHVLKDVAISHLGQRGLRAETAPVHGDLFPSIFVKRAISAEPISIIIPVRNQAEEVKACVDHLRGLRTRHKLQLIIADIASEEPALLRFLARNDMRNAIQIRTEGAFNMARALNLGAARATTRHILFLDPGVTLDDPDPLENLVSRCADPTTAAAAPTLVWPGGIVQSAGLVLSHAIGAAPAGRGLGDSDTGYGDLMRVAQERSAVSAACLLVKRDDHVALNGFDENAFGRGYFAVDYGLRLRARGRRLVVTPHVRAICKRDIFFTDMLGPQNHSALAYRRELETLRRRWGHVLNDDPFYSPLLSLNGDLFSALAWPPRQSTRSPAATRALSFPNELLRSEPDVMTEDETRRHG